MRKDVSKREIKGVFRMHTNSEGDGNDVGEVLPLQGVRVIELGQYIAGPGAAMILCELGADTIKIEPLEGDAARHVGPFGEAMVRGYNRGKRSLAIDLKREGGRDALLKLISTCDVLIQNLRPNAAEKLGIGASEIRRRWPQLIYLSISGFGSSGPSRMRPGYDIAAQAESGLMSITGEPNRLPQKVGAPIIDAATAHVGAQAILAALVSKMRNGVGRTIETSLFEVALHLQLTSWTHYLNGGPEPSRIGDGQPHNAPAADLIRTRDGHIMLSAYTEEHWTRFCRLMDREDLMADPRFSTNGSRVKNRATLREAIAVCLSKYTSAECVELLSKNNIVAAEVREYSKVLSSADIHATGMIADVSNQNGEAYRSLGLPYRIGSMSRRAKTAAPAPGRDSTALLREAGLPFEQIERLKRDGIIRESGCERNETAPSGTCESIQ